MRISRRHYPLQRLGNQLDAVAGGKARGSEAANVTNREPQPVRPRRVELQLLALLSGLVSSFADPTPSPGNESIGTPIAGQT